MRRLVAGAGLAALVVGAVACTDTAPGRAVIDVPTKTGTSSAAALPLSHPCSLVSSLDLRQLDDVTAPVQQVTRTGSSCDFTSSDAVLGYTVRTDAGLADYLSPGGPIHDIRVGTHRAEEQVLDAGSCVIVVGVSRSSRLDVVVTGGGPTDPCTDALTLARMAELRLP